MGLGWGTNGHSRCQLDFFIAGAIITAIVVAAAAAGAAAAARSSEMTWLTMDVC